MVQLSHSYMTTGKTIALGRWIFVNKVMSLIFNMLSTFVLASRRATDYQKTWGSSGLLGRASLSHNNSDLKRHRR